MQRKILCAIYTRVSTDNQAEVEFNSCEAQRFFNFLVLALAYSYEKSIDSEYV